MAKIPDGTFNDWQDSQTIDAIEYKRERELLRIAANDNDDRLSALEASAAGILLGDVQASKITNDNGAPKISVTSTSGDVLAEIVKLGQGMHTFYAISGSKNLPVTNISIRGVAHFSSASFGWVWATDYKNNIFTNYFDTYTWSGWNQLLHSGRDSRATALNGMTLPGTYFAATNTVNAPNTHMGILKVDNTDVASLYLAQTYIDLITGERYERFKYSGVWQPWKKIVYVENEQEIIWNNGANDGWYMNENQTVTPDKKLSQTRNGWILVWSDFDAAAPATTNNFDFSYSYIPKGTLFKDGESHLFTVPNYSSDTAYSVTVKKLRVYDNKLVGHDDNSKSATGTNDVVLRLVLEW